MTKRGARLSLVWRATHLRRVVVILCFGMSCHQLGAYLANTKPERAAVRNLLASQSGVVTPRPGRTWEYQLVSFRTVLHWDAQ